MRFLPVRATLVAGPLSVFFLVAPVAAQGLPPGGPRPSGPPAGVVGPSGAASVQGAPAAAGTSVAVIDVAYIFKNGGSRNTVLVALFMRSKACTGSMLCK